MGRERLEEFIVSHSAVHDQYASADRLCPPSASLTFEISTGAECSPGACDDADVQRRLVV